MYFNSILITIFFLLFNQPQPLQSDSGEIDGVFYEFNHDDSCYSFRGSFVIHTQFDCLIDILYNFKHLKNMMPKAKSISQIQKGENWYDVSYIFKQFFYVNESVYRKMLKLEDQKIVFEMMSSRQNIALFPEVLSSSGYYKIKCESTGYEVEYFQECTLKSALLIKIYMDRAKKESSAFMLGLREYIEKTCR